MTSRYVTIAGFVVLFVAAAALVLISRVRPDRVGRFRAVLAVVCERHVAARATFLLAWAWLGWHFLARTGAP